MLIFNLKKEWYEKIKSGEKKIEYREVKPYWIKRLMNAKYTSCKINFMYGPLIPVFCSYESICKLRNGYSKKHELVANITSVELILDGKDTDLHIDKPVYAIHLANVRVAE